MQLHTIGYEGLRLDQFLELLKAHAIEHLADIREAPVSRKAGFSKESLARAVQAAGIRYSHLRALGCPKPIRDRYRQSEDWSRYTRDFKIYLAGQGVALAALRKEALASRTCLLCYEADVNRCHRRFVAEVIVAPGDTIRHIPARPLSPQGELDL